MLMSTSTSTAYAICAASRWPGSTRLASIATEAAASTTSRTHSAVARPSAPAGASATGCAARDSALMSLQQPGDAQEDRQQDSHQQRQRHRLHDNAVRVRAAGGP